MDCTNDFQDLLVSQVRRMCKGAGVHRYQLHIWIDEGVHEIFRIQQDGSYLSAVTAVSERFRDLIDRLPHAEWRTIALFCMNLVDDADVQKRGLVGRQEALARSGGPGRSKCVKMLRDVIAPELAGLMLAENPHLTD